MTENQDSRAAWIAGAPAAWLMVVLVLLAETARSSGHHGMGNLLSVTQLLVYFAWFRLAWRASRGIADSIGRPAARGALAAGLVLTAML